MDASQYKDYVLVLLFVQYVSDKYTGQPFAPSTIPPGASFAGMVALNDATKLGNGKELVDRVSVPKSSRLRRARRSSSGRMGASFASTRGARASRLTRGDEPRWSE